MSLFHIETYQTIFFNIKTKIRAYYRKKYNLSKTTENNYGKSQGFFKIKKFFIVPIPLFMYNILVVKTEDSDTKPLRN